MVKSTDVLIAGGGPAGLAAALALRMCGAAVTVADAIRPPIEKTCGEGLMPDSRRELAMLGIELAAEEGGEFRGIRFANHAARRDAACGDTDGSDADESDASLADVATARFPSGGSLGYEVGIGVRRKALHARLAECAQQAGVNLIWGKPVQLEDGKCVQVGGEPVRYGLLVGADGQGSRVRRWAGLERGKILSRRFGFRQHFTVEPWSPYVEVHWGRTAQAYITPVGSNEVCVATIARDPHCRLQTVLDQLPWLRAKLRGRLAHAVTTDAERGALTTTRRLNRVACEHGPLGPVALLGDASGSADAITGEGMAMAFRQALLLAECVDAGNLARYNRLHPKILRLPLTMARVMLLMDRSATFRSRAIGLLADHPQLFARMLGVHVGAESPGRFIASKGLELAWRLAVPARAASARVA
jgi:2-polyprenyl-6-methoxyphenol hydroxylase-like FAD-dependent oxidoreductase